MSSFAYSTRLAALLVNSGQTVNAFTVPAGHRAVIKSVDTNQVGGASVGMRIRLAGTNRLLLRVATPTGAVDIHWYGHQVVHENETATVTADGAAGDIAISGYLLTGAGGPLGTTTKPGPT
jgi:hypothetical protein